MSQFVKLIEDALKAGDRSDPVFRKAVYEAALKAFDRTVENSDRPAAFSQKYKLQIVDAISEIERDHQNTTEGLAPSDVSSLKGNHGDITVDQEQSSDSVNMRSDVPVYISELEGVDGGNIITRFLSVRPGRVGVIAGAIIVFVLVLALAYLTFFKLGSESNGGTTPEVSPETMRVVEGQSGENDQAFVQTTQEIDSEPVRFELGDRIVTRGEADWNVIDGIGVMTDSSLESIELYQWVISGIEAGQKHSLELEVQGRPSGAAYLQLQVIYSAPQMDSRIYTYVLNLAAGKVEAKGEFAFSAREMEVTSSGDFIMKTETESPRVSSNMQIVIMPVLGTNATGAAFINRLVVEPAG